MPVCEHRYPRAAIWQDYARAGVGLAATGGPLLAMQPPLAITGVLAAVAGLFVIYLGGTWRRQRLVIVRQADGLLLKQAGHSYPFSALQQVRLDYYSTRRDRRRGWMQLTIRVPGARIRVDSRLTGFTELVRTVIRAAVRRGLCLSDGTRENLRALGISPPQG